MKIKIIGIGSYIPNKEVSNTDFGDHVFLNEDGTPFAYPNEVVIKKFKGITGIENRRYAEDQHTSSDLAFFAAERALENAKIDRETLDYIIFAHNFGDVKSGTNQSDILPSLATRVKNKLDIKNPKCVAYDILFGCPGWIEGVLQANAFIKSGMAKRVMVIGAETLSRVVDDHDRDSMIYSDGAGVSILEASDDEAGLLSYESATFANDEANFLFFGKSYNPDLDPDIKYIKMYGRKIYEFALSQVPCAMKSCLDKSGIGIDEVKKILIHQANEKMDEAIIARFYKLYDKTAPENIMPMSIHDLGNSSVATVPTLYDLLIQGKLENHEINKGDVVIFASVGAGMNVNAFVYRY
ncbi:3-oxoacyl-ACP synthase III family protein [Flavobacterium bizetiae]|uniref:3-oxoacyl-[acyl-carrier-protein] synthase 3 protein 1 n=1 Tax=Flavobacterium bizetiae TaxID=2704140 RepID=A0A6J4GVZ0_9FLAO|nr:ketoacyl-ACP synthase III [Flavobacterium bizetiae]CAA9202383.1 3-oxoacyl-[acyl-carrier-protein] synthase 3 protein 1 [Flavobacterium bizetiae]CAD5344788.1 3-oxoacyl-[acyl-carrier-protein] synthase 3 protein 1 [Flavobacterium bizetiae]CAD5350705.1 3-oxoacyl-[acyl-carrier-protein] synthase 3 protein 1 [Flavobacterium bizetiae]